ncbi:hypothetical protein J6590_057982 [Homalodisca vitripennis]|nr:hypothetical protein J6590_057982 [Homalodisca vitripennis]
MDHVRTAVVHIDITDHYSTGLTISVSRDITTTNSDNAPRSYIEYTLLTDSLACVDWPPVLVGQELADVIDSSGVPIVNDADFTLDCVFTLNTCD